MRLEIIDTETTELDPEANEVIEFAIIRMTINADGRWHLTEATKGELAH